MSSRRDLKGLSERELLLKYPVRLALNPIISSIGWILPSIVSGATVTAIVMNIPTIGALLYESLLAQDTYVAAACDHAAVVYDRDRHVYIGYSAGRGRSAHPPDLITLRLEKVRTMQSRSLGKCGRLSRPTPHPQ